MAVGDGATWAEHAYRSGNRRLQLTKVRHHGNLTVVLFIVSTRFLVYGPPVPHMTLTRNHQLSIVWRRLKWSKHVINSPQLKELLLGRYSYFSWCLFSG